MGDFERRWSYATYYRYPDELKEGMTDAEVLAEMGTPAVLRWLRQQALKEGWTFDARAMYEIMEADDG